ncbi:MAG: hypothetical protein AAGH92_13085 [Planctomycetota bacterium]
MPAAAVPVVSERFPQYTDFDPLVPIRCVTPDIPGCIHRFFDTTPISPSGRYLAVFQVPTEDRLPRPGETAAIHVVDLQAGTTWQVATTQGWEPQLGPHLNWGGDDHTLFFNDVDVETWEPHSVRIDPLADEPGLHAERFDGTVYHASPDGRWLASADLRAMARTQRGYGVVVPDAVVPRRIGFGVDDGLWLTCTATGRRKLVVTIADLMRAAASKRLEGRDPDAFEAYGFHSKFSPCGRRLLFTVRWIEHDPDGPAFDWIQNRKPELRFTVFTMTLGDVEADGFPEITDLVAAIGDEQWEKHGHHVNWLPDGSGLTTNLRIDRAEMRFVRCGVDGTDLREVVPGAIGSGHPSVHPTANHFLTDVYAHEDLAFGDGTTPLRWIDVESGEERCVARYPSRTPAQDHDPALRLDPHPAWDRTWTHVAFNAFLDGTRRVMVADMRPLLDA